MSPALRVTHMHLLYVLTHFSLACELKFDTSRRTRDPQPSQRTISKGDRAARNGGNPARPPTNAKNDKIQE